MRPASTDQDFARHPMNELFGTPANVRLLRVLAEEASGPMGVPEAAEKAGLTEAGARRALKRLSRTGFVERLGGGRSQSFQLREPDALTEHIRLLFRTERQRFDEMVRRLRSVLRGFPEISVAWLDELPIGAGEPLHIGVIADSASLAHLGPEIRNRILDLEGQYDLTMEIHTFSGADAPEIQWARTTLLAGHADPEHPSPIRSSNHADRVARARRISQRVAELLDHDASLVRRAQRHIELLLQQDQGPASHDLREWLDILNHYSPERLKDFLVAETPRAQRLRQSSPFFAVLTARERDEILDHIERHDP
jgi:predicted transcriptional regulator